MTINSTILPGAFVIESEPRTDDRGSFARTFCARELAACGVTLAPVQANVATTRRRGTVRGLHYQVAPSLEPKLIRCTRGAIHDVVVDLRQDSSTYGQHIGVELSAANMRALFVPALCAHGYQTLDDDCQVEYLVGGYYDPACERGVRYDDPALGIAWPLPAVALSGKDANWPLLPAFDLAVTKGRS